MPIQECRISVNVEEKHTISDTSQEQTARRVETDRAVEVTVQHKDFFQRILQFLRGSSFFDFHFLPQCSLHTDSRVVMYSS